jgi:hypothetical protein
MTTPEELIANEYQPHRPRIDWDRIVSGAFILIAVVATITLSAMVIIT